jgi:predicted DCC family thiol-disulfide oxidoreductase YuxK
MGSPDPLDHPIILFDGVCNLCNGSVLFIIKRDPASKFYFAALQSDFGKEQLKKFGLPTVELNSVLLLEGGKLHQRSSAALEIARRLSGAWPALYIFKLIPSFIRNIVYDWIAHNRYRWFGKKEACMIPTPELKSRFLP